MAVNFIGWNYDTALMAMRRISIQPKISSITLIINIFFSLILVKYYGVYGAAYSIIITNVIQCVLRFIFFNP